MVPCMGMFSSSVNNFIKLTSILSKISMLKE